MKSTENLEKPKKRKNSVMNFSDGKLLKPLIKRKLKLRLEVKNGEPRFEVGDIAKIFWKMRHPATFFCTLCAKPLASGYIISDKCRYCGSPLFNKKIGEAKVIQVLNVYIAKSKKKRKIYQYLATVNKCGGDDIELQLALRAGFKEANDMFEHLDKKFDLLKGLEFYGYGLRWANG